MNGHSSSGPDWRCATCSEDWPCDLARKLLAEAYLTDPTQLARHLAGLMARAAADLAVADPARLYRRFVGWTLTPENRCRICGKSGHDPIPGVPPRLIPCHGGTPAVHSRP